MTIHHLIPTQDDMYTFQLLILMQFEAYFVVLMFQKPFLFYLSIWSSILMNLLPTHNDAMFHQQFHFQHK